MANEEYLQKFGYRSYEGLKTEPKQRIFSLIWFEVTSIWHKSVLGRVILVIVVIANFIGVIVSATFNANSDFLPPELLPTEADKIDLLHNLVAGYMSFTFVPVEAGTYQGIFGFTFSIGIVLIALFGISGGGLFADDREGNVVEIYMSKMKRGNYITGKIGTIIVYTNIFIMAPLLVLTFFSIQSYDLNHLDLIGLYLGIIVYSLILSLIIGLFVLSLSMVMKRNYAALSFFLIYLLGSVFGSLVYSLESSNELLLLVSPESFFTLLGYLCVGDMNLALYDTNFNLVPFYLNDGIGLEAWHIVAVALGYITILGTFLYYKIRKLTTEAL